ncbi:MAG: polysaccharide biosynthesis/export family protein [Prevotellaceae bacterium]|jgi:polysaccharide export outer membrane protein|nr:polysaccharide biosynthesis/export family protein [Prevotellaceae bacterium]
MNIKRAALATAVILLLVSCKTKENAITYFQNLEQTELLAAARQGMDYTPRIVADDQLSIVVSSIDPSAVAAFNLPLASVQSVDQLQVSTTPSLQTYLVSSEGMITFPVLGEVKAAGLTCSELTDTLTGRLRVYVKSPIVTIRLLNSRIAVLGEVNSPGTKTFYNERLSILDALGLAGDLTIYGNRKNVLLIRNNNGVMEHHRFDLTQAETLTSPYFYLQQNDVIYVEPNKARRGNAKYSQNEQYNLSVISTVVSTLSVIASLLIALLVK